MAEYDPDRDFFLCSYPKTGRTWLRFLLAQYIVLLFDIDLRLDLDNVFCVIPNNLLSSDSRGLRRYAFARHDHMPRVRATHQHFDANLFAGTRVLFLTRGIEDTLVSYYFHRARHSGVYGEYAFAGTTSDFIRDERWGITPLIDYLNGWATGLETTKEYQVIRYEDLSRNPEPHVTAAVTFLGLPLVENHVTQAIRASRFDRMQRLERERGLPDQQRGSSDADALRVRRGTVGGYLDYLAADDVEYIRQQKRTRLARHPATQSL